MATDKKLKSSKVEKLKSSGKRNLSTSQPFNLSTTGRVPTRPVVVDAAHCWLERTNPLVGVSIRVAQNIWDAARGGDTQRLHWLFQEIEAANPILFTCIDRRQSAIAGFQLKVSALPSADETLADEQKEAVENFLSGIENLTETLEHLDTAFFRGFALAQPIWEEDGTVREIRLHNSWEFLVHDGVLYHNPECNGFSRSAVSCADAGLIGIQRRRAIDYPALSIHIRHAVSERDWGRFLERYALPKPAVTMAPNATNAQRDDYLAAARAVENGQVSVWPNGSNITDFAGGSRGTDPFGNFIEHQEKLIVLLATGGTLTSLAQSDTGSLAGGAQMKVWREIVQRDAGVLGQAVQRSLIAPYLERTFGARPCAVDFALTFPEERSAQDAANVAATLKQAGWRVDQGELEKAVGFTLEREESTPSQPPFGLAKAKTAFKNDEKALQNAPGAPDAQGDLPAPPPSQIAKKRPSGARAVLEAFAQDSVPVAEAVAALLQDLSKESCEKFLADLPNLLPDDPATATVLADAMAEAMADELAGDVVEAAASDQPRGKTTPESTPGSFKPKDGAGSNSQKKPAADKAGSSGDTGSSGEPAEAANDGKIDFKGNARAKAKADNQAQALGYAGIDDLMMQSKSVPSERVAEIVAGGEQPCKPHEAVAALRSHATIQPNVKGEEPVKLTERPIRHYVCGERRHRGGEPEVSRLESLPLAIKAIRESDSFYHEMGGERVVRMPGEQLPKGTQTVYERKSGTGKSKAFAYTDSGVLNGWQLN